LKRHESFAANLGAKLTGPLLIKSFENIFDGPIKVTAPYATAETPNITWLDVLEFARAKPQEFTLKDSGNAGRVCSFWTKNSTVEISEDDYRRILSGAPERMIPTQPIPDDEIAEQGTIEIMEQRFSQLIKAADLLAARARQLNWELKGRKAAIASRRAASQSPEQNAPGHQSPFHTINQSASNGDSRSLHQDLLRQFQADERKPHSLSQRIKQPRPHAEPTTSPTGGLTPTVNAPRRTSQAPQNAVDDGTGGHYRPMMTAKVEKLNRNDAIFPPCDRCRRLQIACTKHLTACAGCTKKHCKCTWKDILESEIGHVFPIHAGPVGNEENLHHASDVNENLDPGLRGNRNGMEMGENGEVFGGGGKRSDGLMDEHSILSHMASAAAAVGNQ
jgi:hypothetical protein